VLYFPITDSTCGGEFLDSNYGQISSPNYPNSYPDNAECYWTVTNNNIGRYYTWNITVHSFELQEHYDYLYIGTPNEQYRKLVSVQLGFLDL